MLSVIFMAMMGAQASGTGPATDCRAPEPPAVIRPIKPTRPEVPSCVDEARSRHNCRAPILNAYNRQFDAYSLAFKTYVDTLNTYTRDLTAYAGAASDYAVCERRSAGPEGLITD